MHLIEKDKTIEKVTQTIKERQVQMGELKNYYRQLKALINKKIMKKIMKKIILSIIGLFFYLVSNSQTPVQVVNVPGSYYAYLGSLVFDDNSYSNSQKIIVKIFGGSWFSDSNGETTYYISNRDGISVKQISLGSYSQSRLKLKAYKNGTNIDFYIAPSQSEYTSFAVTSFSFGNGINERFIDITIRSTVPTGTDISSSINIVPIMMTDESGNVGLGTSTPNEKLAVNGKIRAREIKVEAGNWPDYVFEERYNVGTLEGLESYIKMNKHLPGMPTAKEIAENGLELGEMVRLQQQKIEELTLHLIDKDKALKKVEVENTQLKAKQAEQDTAIKKMIGRMDKIELKKTVN
ncbi:hypothetical protein QFZ20_002168 [Flavobacterium sp. W4I14]|nr:hypothetical protein [Flavobacterium sp. W4I14]